MRVNGEDRKCGPAGPRQRGLVLSFRDHDSGTNQVDLPFPLPAGTCGGTATRQTGKTRAPLLVTLALLGLLGVQLFRGGAALLDTGSSPLQGQPDRATSPAASSLVDLDKVRAARLFSTPATAGQSATAAAAVPPPASLPPSGPVRLEGVVMATDPARSVAFLRSGNRQQAYRAGDTLADGALVLREIARDHVLLHRRGEILRLDLHASAAASAPAASSAADLLAGISAALPRINQSDLEGAMQQVNAAFNVASLSEVIQIRPAQRNGRLVGYQLNPGVRIKEFVQLGLRTGDIVTAVNGIPLDDLSALQSLGSLMNGATEVSFSLLREGQVQNLRISLQALAANTRAPETTTNNNMERP